MLQNIKVVQFNSLWLDTMMKSRPLEINMVTTRMHIANERNFGTKDAIAILKIQPCLRGFEL